jgi:recombinational DNA repair protein RecR
MAKGSKMLQYKEVLNRLETESPGTKQTFYWGFREAKQKQPTATTMAEKDRAVLHPCTSCNQPTTAEVCSYCKMMARAKTAIPR